ncbi:glycosyltransferase family 39 protein [bacterium]|nr:glycosyltransferase family 39 protein [bacterium]
MNTETKELKFFYIGSFLISLLSSYFIWLQTSKYGVDLSPDSIVYMKWAQNILDNGLGFIISNNDAKWPPLYPLIIAVFSKISHADIVSVARHFSCCLIFFTCFLLTLLLKKLSGKRFVSAIAFGLFIPFSIPLNLVYSFAWSEPLFIFLLILIAFSIEKTTYSRLVLCGFLSASAILTRYAGVTIVPAVCLLIFIQKSSLTDKIKKCFCYAIIPTLIYITYIFRNYYFTKTLMGPRVASSTGLILNATRACATIALWFSGRNFFVATLFILIFIIVILNHKKQIPSYFVKCSNIAIFSISFLVIYFIFIVISSTTTAYDPIDVRLMSPAFPFILITLFSAFVSMDLLQQKTKFYYAGLLLYLFLISISVVTTIEDLEYRKNHGTYGYNSVSWQENKLILYLKESDIIQSSDPVISNDPFALFIVNKKIYADSAYQSSTSICQKFGGYFFVLFYIPTSSPLERLFSECEMETITKTSDGSLFRITNPKQ